MDEFERMEVKTLKKILFTDLDGTLLNDDSVVKGRMKEALDDLVKAGHTLVLSSGRPLKSILEVKRLAGIDYKGVYIIANNGSLVYDCDTEKVIHKMTIPMEYVTKVWDLCYGRGIHVQTYLGDDIVCKAHNEEIDVYTSKVHMNCLYCEEASDIMTEEPCKMLVIKLDDHEALVEIQDLIRRDMGDMLQTVFSESRYLEVFHKNAGKGNALKWMCEYLQIPVEHSYSAGDAENDMTMIEAAGTGIAMANGDPHLKEVADIVTEKSNHEYGLADVIYDVILTKE